MVLRGLLRACVRGSVFWLRAFLVVSCAAATVRVLIEIVVSISVGGGFLIMQRRLKPPLQVERPVNTIKLMHQVLSFLRRWKKRHIEALFGLYGTLRDVFQFFDLLNQRLPAFETHPAGRCTFVGLAERSHRIDAKF